MHCKKTFHLESFDFFKKCSQIYKSLIKLLSFVSELEKTWFFLGSLTGQDCWVNSQQYTTPESGVVTQQI
jgi:hypothetical protein